MKTHTKYSKNLDDSTLWSNLKAGDKVAFSFLFKKYYEDLVRYGKSLSTFPEKVEDCVQDVFTDLWVYKNKLSDVALAKPYLLASVRKRIIRTQERDSIFSKSTSLDSVSFLFECSIEDHFIAAETSDSKILYLNKLLNELPARQKEALYLRFNQGLTVSQIAVLLDVNYQSANNLLHRALLSLRKEWNGTNTVL
ncbi:sigma-70 family RNA polymerase sigma factor [Flavobacterium sp.]|uniref:RNA polymerase sigma factor n=1 Tax=Flavobacterium sp. TaxID=239 RepID=UPI00286CA5AD|nr:sigma-70 family RNA polymerase sigma factor [Flavobacterium sp.]